MQSTDRPPPGARTPGHDAGAVFALIADGALAECRLRAQGGRWHLERGWIPPVASRRSLSAHERLEWERAERAAEAALLAGAAAAFDPRLAEGIGLTAAWAEAVEGRRVELRLGGVDLPSALALPVLLIGRHRAADTDALIALVRRACAFAPAPLTPREPGGRQPAWGGAQSGRWRCQIELRGGRSLWTDTGAGELRSLTSVAVSVRRESRREALDALCAVGVLLGALATDTAPGDPSFPPEAAAQAARRGQSAAFGFSLSSLSLEPDSPARLAVAAALSRRVGAGPAAEDGPVASGPARVVLLSLNGVVLTHRAQARAGGAEAPLSELDPVAVGLVDRLCRDHQAGLVICCEHRTRRRRLEIEDDLRAAGLTAPFHPDWATPDHGQGGAGRGGEAAAWLAQHPEVEGWVALDTDSLWLEGQPVVRTDRLDGMLLRHWIEADRLLGGGTLQKT